MSKDLFYVIHPIYKLGRILGILPFPINGPAQHRYLKISKSYFVISSVLQVVISIRLFWCFFTRVGEFVGKSNILIILALLTAIIFEHLYFLADIINKILYRNHIIKIFNCVYQQSEIVRKFGLKLPYNRLRKYCFTYLVFHTLTMIYDLIICWVYMLKLNSINDIVYGVISTYANISQTVSVSLYFAMFLAAQNIFRNITTILARSFLRNPPVNIVGQFSNIELLDSIVDSYQNLTGALRKFNKTVSSQILILMGVYFSNITLQFLALVQQLIYNGRQGIYFTVFGFISVFSKDVVKLWLLLDAADKCQKEVCAYFKSGRYRVTY